MTAPTLIDTGPIVAIFSAQDQHHASMTALLPDLHPPLITCWPVVTEAAGRLRGRADWVDALMEACEGGLLHIEPMQRSDLAAVRLLLGTYRTLRLQLADACLLTLADRLNADRLVSFDRRDFGVARTPRDRLLRIIPEI